MPQTIILDKHDKKMAIQEMEDLRNSMLGDLERIKNLIGELTRGRGMIMERAEAYWLTSIENNLSAESGSFLGCMTNFSDTIKELKEMMESEEA